MRKITTTFCTQCDAKLEPGSKQCGQAYSDGDPMQLRSWDTQDENNEWLVVRTQIPVKCFEAARNERGNVRWPKDPDAVVSVVEIDVPAPVRAAPAVSTLEAENEALRARLAELEAAIAPKVEEPIEAEPPSDPLGPLEALKAKIDAVRAGTQEMTPDELISMHRDDPPGAAAKLEDAIRALKGDARRKLSELLNVELAELKNLRGMAGEDREREQQIEYLLGLFTRLGEI